MKAVLLPIHPKYCELIADGEKTIEVRKTRPKLETPFKCYIYQTRPKRLLIEVIRDGDELYGETYHGKTVFITTHKDVSSGNRTFGRWGKIIGEFVCDNIFDILISISNPEKIKKAYPFPSTGLTDIEVMNYLGNGKEGFGWHISDLVIYNEPKELGEFHRPCTPQCNFSEECGGSNTLECLFGISRPPQSWCYVEELT